MSPSSSYQMETFCLVMFKLLVMFLFSLGIALQSIP